MPIPKLSIQTFLSSLLLDYSIQTSRKKNVLSFYHKDKPSVHFLPRLSLPPREENSTYITYDTPIHRFYYKKLSPLYFLAKKDNAYLLYCRRAVKTSKTPYFLPPTQINLQWKKKTELLASLEEKFLYNPWPSLFYSEGDVLSYLQDPTYLFSLARRIEITNQKHPSFLAKLYPWIKDRLDKRPSSPL